MREPSQVFLLLEAVYDSFDKIAKKNGVFKVETIGDCYGEWVLFRIRFIFHARALEVKLNTWVFDESQLQHVGCLLHVMITRW